MMAARPVAHHGAVALTERLRNLIVMPLGQLARGHAAPRMELGDRVRRPDARPAIERGPQVIVEQLAAGRYEQLVKGAEQTGIAAGKEKSVEVGARQSGGGLDEGVPRARYLGTRPAAVAVEEIATVVEQPHVQIARHLQQCPVDAGELERPRQKVIALG